VGRPVLISAIAIAVAAYAMAVTGWNAASIPLGAVVVLVAAITVFQVHRAVRHLHGQSRRERRSAIEAERHYIAVLRRIVRLAEARDRYWRGHSRNVAKLTGRIAQHLGLPKRRCELLSLAGELHDIGMLAVPEAVRLSYSRLGTEAFRSVKRHSEVSHEVLKPLRTMAEVLPAIRHHHERMNGTGYPKGLSGQDIPLGARIIAVADAFDAMTHDRPHRAAMSPFGAMDELRRCAPAGFDARCVEGLAAALNMPELPPDGAGAAALASPAAAAV
jgi:HD-GYP domain-containing protein (c-di-GMP phosphodiesterase class II)